MNMTRYLFRCSSNDGHFDMERSANSSREKVDTHLSCLLSPSIKKVADEYLTKLLSRHI